MADTPQRRSNSSPQSVDSRGLDLLAENERLTARVEDLQREQRELVQRLAEMEEHNRALESLFVTAYRLHATLDPGEVLTALDEILINLVGAEAYGVWAVGQDGEPGELLLGSRDAQGPGTLSSEERTLARTTFTLGAWFPQPGRPRPGVNALAIVPLRVESDLMAVLLLRNFLEHKTGMTKIDRRVLGLIADQAGRALLSAKLHAMTRDSAP
jgi:hypothetical protein